MGHDDVASGYPISTGFRRLTGCQRDPQDMGVTKDITRSGLFIIHAACIIEITKTNHSKSVGMPICQHEILGTLKILQNFLSRFLVAFTKITHVPAQLVDNNSNIRMCAYLRIHQAAHN